MTLLHFNARSVLRRWDEISAEMLASSADVFCISESWVTDPIDFAHYALPNYATFGSCRPSKKGGGVLLCVKDCLRPAACRGATDVSPSDAYNICAVKLLGLTQPTLVVGVYRPPDACVADTEAFFDDLSLLIDQQPPSIAVLVAGDFNIAIEGDVPPAQPRLDVPGGEGLLAQFAADYGLTQLVHQPTRGSRVIDLVLASVALSASIVSAQPPVASSDHSSQIIYTPFLTRRVKSHRAAEKVNVTDFDTLRAMLAHVKWREIFASSRDVDDYVAVFSSVLNEAMEKSSYVRRRRPCTRNLPRSVLKLIQRKKVMWARSQATGDRAAYHQARNACRAAINDFYCSYERTLIEGANRKKFFSYVSSQLKGPNCQQNCTLNGTMSGEETAEKFSAEFASNFSAAGTLLNEEELAGLADDGGLLLNCTQGDVTEALQSCANSAAGPDGVSFTTIKKLANVLAAPLTIIFQQSLAQGLFPTKWKMANVIPIYKGKGDKSSAASYRPVSLCPCFGKLLETIVKKQLERHVDMHAPLSSTQHGFRAGRSTTSNLLACDARIADLVNQSKPYDIITFDFRRAFDRVPHADMLAALADVGLQHTSLKWFSSYFSDRQQRVVVAGTSSEPKGVTSGVVQGSVLGPLCFSIFINPLLVRLADLLPNSSFAYADDVKFVIGTTEKDYALASSAITVLSAWAVKHNMPLSLEKCVVLYCGCNNPARQYTLGGAVMPSTLTFKDLGIVKAPIKIYQDHYNQMVANCRRTSGMVRRCFRSRDARLQWQAFNAYVRPCLMYGSCAWSPLYRKDVNLVEGVQQRFTKWLPGFSHLSYNERLRRLNTLSLEHARQCADVTYIFKCLRGLHGVRLEDIGLALSFNNERSGRVRLQQRVITNNKAAALFSFRACKEWNRLPLAIADAVSLRLFTQALHIMYSSRY